MRRLAMIALWLVATAITTAVAYFAVNAAGASVTDRPLTALVATDNPTTTTDVSTTGPSSTTTSISSTLPTGTSPTSTSSSPTATTAPWEQTTVNSAAGAVIVSYRPDEVRLESVVPLAGFGFEIDEAGPDEVRVEFEAAEIKVEVRIRWENGALVTEVNEDN